VAKGRKRAKGQRGSEKDGRDGDHLRAAVFNVGGSGHREQYRPHSGTRKHGVYNSSACALVPAVGVQQAVLLNQGGVLLIIHC
jgi:hypothetical protein